MLSRPAWTRRAAAPPDARHRSEPFQIRTVTDRALSRFATAIHHQGFALFHAAGRDIRDETRAGITQNVGFHAGPVVLLKEFAECSLDARITTVGKRVVVKV